MEFLPNAGVTLCRCAGDNRSIESVSDRTDFLAYAASANEFAKDMNGEGTPRATFPRVLLLSWSIATLSAKEEIVDMEFLPKAAMRFCRCAGNNRSIASVSDDTDFLVCAASASEFAKDMDGGGTARAIVPSVFPSWSSAGLSVNTDILDKESKVAQMSFR